MIFSRIDRIKDVLYLIGPLVESHNLSSNLDNNDSLGILYKVLLVYEIYYQLVYIGKSKITIIYKCIFIEDLNLIDNQEFNCIVCLIKKSK